MEQKSWLLAALLSLAFAVVAPVSLASDDDDDDEVIEEVVVTAYRWPTYVYMSGFSYFTYYVGKWGVAHIYSRCL